jgi:hypothetical protein
MKITITVEGTEAECERAARAVGGTVEPVRRAPTRISRADYEDLDDLTPGGLDGNEGYEILDLEELDDLTPGGL